MAIYQSNILGNGFKGPQGVQGTTGSQGTTGAQGVTLSQGIQGISGSADTLHPFLLIGG